LKASHFYQFFPDTLKGLDQLASHDTDVAKLQVLERDSVDSKATEHRLQEQKVSQPIVRFHQIASVMPPELHFPPG